MSQQHILARRILAAAWPTACRATHTSSCLLFRPHARYSSSSSSISPPSHSPPTVPHSPPSTTAAAVQSLISKRPKRNTRRKADISPQPTSRHINPNRAYHPPHSKTPSSSSSSSTASSSSTSDYASIPVHPGYRSKSDRKWDAATDQKIIELFKKGVAWKNIDYTLNRPPSACYRRYYTALDPNLEAWLLPNGQQNEDMIRRLRYLHETEGHPFVTIEKLELMKEPWQTPTGSAPEHVKDAFAVVEAMVERSEMRKARVAEAIKAHNSVVTVVEEGATATTDHEFGTDTPSTLEIAAVGATGSESEATTASKDDSEGNTKKAAEYVWRPINRLSLEKTYLAYLNLLTTNAFRTNRKLLERAVRRGVELYDDNWKKVASHADEMLDLWTTTRAAKSPVVGALTSKTTTVASAGALLDVVDRENILDEHHDDELALEREPLTPNKVASFYRTLQRKGVDWGLEDDAVMTRKILELSRTRPNILDILAQPLSQQHGERQMDLVRHFTSDSIGDDSSNTADGMSNEFWTEISVAVGTHTPVQCKRRWDGLWNLMDGDKKSQSKSFHRFERYQFWMLWSHFFQQGPIRHSYEGTDGDDNDALKNENRSDSQALISISNIQNSHVFDVTPQDSLTELEDACRRVSFAKDISRWMRHRSEAQCERFFKMMVFTELSRSGLLSLQFQGGSDTLQEHDSQETSQQQQVTRQNKGQDSARSFMNNAQKPVVIKSYITTPQALNLILDQIAEPMLHKLTHVQSVDPTAVLRDRYQNMVRSDWTREQIQALQQIVMKMKQGVKVADFKVNWYRVARTLRRTMSEQSTRGQIHDVEQELLHGTPLHHDQREEPELTDEQEKEQEKKQQQQWQHYMTAEQCQNCWECLSASPSRKNLFSSSISSSSEKSSTISDASDKDINTEGAESDRHLDNWTDLELRRLQQGVRALGTSWADIRAQYLPNKNVSDLYKAWQLISAPTGSDTVQPTFKGEEFRLRRGSVNRLLEPDYQGLLGVLDKVKDKRSDPSKDIDKNNNNNNNSSSSS
ncbi:hypothetical protein EDD11_005177 [Mortierella claussenii]|nr:hypothetical protein EDD11_005177 [Mortierella claussenii]